MTLERSHYNTHLAGYLNTNTPASDGDRAFSQHDRIDRTADGLEVGYRGADTWESTKAELAREVTVNGAALAWPRLLPVVVPAARQGVPANIGFR